MAFQSEPPLKGALIFLPQATSQIEVFYDITREELETFASYQEEPVNARLRIASYNFDQDLFTTYPFVPFEYDPAFLTPKYESLRAISFVGYGLNNYFDSFEDVNSDSFWEVWKLLPDGFQRGWGFGFGILKEYKLLVDVAIEAGGFEEIRITRSERVGADDSVYWMPEADFETMKSEIDRFHSNALRVGLALKRQSTFSYFAKRLGLEEKPLRFRNNTLSHQLKPLIETDQNLDAQEVQNVIDTVSDNARAIANTNPKLLAKLKEDIELVTLERLVDKFGEMIGQRLKEGDWQKFFWENPFVLTMVVGSPIMVVSQQAFVGGTKLLGEGDKIADYLVKNFATGNSAIIEIKTPDSELCQKKEYRGLNPPSKELVGSVNQVLEQKNEFVTNFHRIKSENKLWDVAAYHIRCFVIIGRTPSTENAKKAFEIYRGNSRNVDVLTFDELLGSLKQLLELLKSGR